MKKTIAAILLALCISPTFATEAPKEPVKQEQVFIATKYENIEQVIAQLELTHEQLRVALEKLEVIVDEIQEETK